MRMRFTLLLLVGALLALAPGIAAAPALPATEPATDFHCIPLNAQCANETYCELWGSGPGTGGIRVEVVPKSLRNLVDAIDPGC